MLPRYQINVAAERGECVSAGGCLNSHPFDNITVRLSMYYVRALGSASGGQRFYIPDQRDLYDLNLDEMELYGFNIPEVCIFTDPFLPAPIDLCIDNAQWVPKWYTGHEPAIVTRATFPNILDFDSVAMAIDCSENMQGLFAEYSTDIAKMVTWPVGPQGGPCWFDPDYGEEKCADSGAPGALYEGAFTMDGDSFSCQPGTCARYTFFNCPLSGATAFGPISLGSDSAPQNSNNALAFIQAKREW